MQILTYSDLIHFLKNEEFWLIKLFLQFRCDFFAILLRFLKILEDYLDEDSRHIRNITRLNFTY